MHLQLPSTARAGIVALFLAAGMYLPVRWAETRNFRPLSIPITLKPGHIRTPAFNVNLATTYYMGIEFDFPEPGAPPVCESYPVVKANWTLFGESGFPPHFKSPAKIVDEGEFDLIPENLVSIYPGTYLLDLEVHDPGCAARLRSRLYIYTEGEGYEHFAYWLRMVIVLIAGAGVVLFLRTPIELLRARAARVRQQEVCIFTPPDYVYRSRFRRVRPPPIFFRPPDFGMVLSFVALPLLVVFFLISRSIGSIGIEIPLSVPTGPFQTTDPRASAFLVWLDDHGNYFLNSKQAPREHLQQAIQDELAKRVEWTVYFEAAPNARFQDAAFAMNAIQSAHGKLVWLTPAARALLSRPHP